MTLMIKSARFYYKNRTASQLPAYTHTHSHTQTLYIYIYTYIYVYIYADVGETAVSVRECRPLAEAGFGIYEIANLSQGLRKPFIRVLLTLHFHHASCTNGSSTARPRME